MRRSRSMALRRCRPITSELEFRGFDDWGPAIPAPRPSSPSSAHFLECGEGTAMITIRHETPFDVARREALLDGAFGDCRCAKTAERLREDRLPAEGLSFVGCADGRLMGTVRLWNIAAGRGRPALLLGPLAVASDFRQCGIGGDLIRHALEQARR